MLDPGVTDASAVVAVPFVAHRAVDTVNPGFIAAAASAPDRKNVGVVELVFDTNTTHTNGGVTVNGPLTSAAGFRPDDPHATVWSADVPTSVPAELRSPTKFWPLVRLAPPAVDARTTFVTRRGCRTLTRIRFTTFVVGAVAVAVTPMS